MSSKQEVFEGCQITIEDGQKLYINQKEIEYEHDEKDGKWSSKYLPYTQYESIDALAKAIVSDTAEFKA